MLRVLQSVEGKNVDAQCKAKVAFKRGMFVNKDYATKEAVLPTVDSEVYLVDRGLVNDNPAIAAGAVFSEYDEVLDNIKAGEFVNLVTILPGERYAVDAFDGVDADFEAGKYLVVSTTVDEKQGKLVASPTNTKSNFRSLGKINDNGHALVAFEYVR